MAGESADPAEEPVWSRSDATLRIFGRIPALDAITATLGLSPTHTHRRGDRRRARFEPFPHDLWSYRAPVPEDRPLDVHIQTLWSHLKPHRDFLIGLKGGLTVDVFCGFRTNALGGGFEVSPRALELFIELEVPFAVSLL